MRPVIFTRTLVASAVGAVAASQTTAGAGNLTINGTLSSGGVATLDTQRQIGITSAGNDSAINFTITGTDSQGRVISEVLAGPNIGTVNSVLNYLTVTKIAASAAVAAAVTVDTIASGASQEVPLDIMMAVFNVNLVVEVTGTVNYTVQYTFDDVYAAAGGSVNWNNHSSLTNQTTNQNGTLVGPTRAVRILTNSGTGSAKLIVLQTGLL